MSGCSVRKRRRSVPLAGHADRLAIAFHPPVLPVNSQAMAYAVTGQGPGFSPAAPDGKGALRFLTAQQFCKVFFYHSFFPVLFRYFLSFPLDFAADLRYYFNTKECILLRKPFSDTPAAGTGHPLFCLDILPFHPLPLSLPRDQPRPQAHWAWGRCVFLRFQKRPPPGQEPNGGLSISMFSAAGGSALIPESGSPRPRRFRCTGCGRG